MLKYNVRSGMIEENTITTTQKENTEKRENK